jgi:serine/threonine protein kinase
MYEMLYGHPPYKAPNHIQLQRLIETSGPLPYPKSVQYTRGGAGGSQVCYSVSEACIDLIQSLLKKNSIERISCEELFAHPYFASDHSQDGRGWYLLLRQDFPRGSQEV